MIDKIRLWWKFEAQFYYRNFIIGIKNLINWFPVIWKDKDWDSYYIFRILEHKLTLQAKGISKRNIHTVAQRDAEVMRTCVRLMEKVREDYYASEYFDYYKTKIWFESVDDKPGYSTWESEIISENFNDYFKKYSLIYKRVLKGEGIFNINEKSENERKNFVAMNIAHINQQRANKLLFKMLENNIKRWWD
jgi:ABC-type antimicrobial peptide transport system permease subunit